MKQRRDSISSKVDSAVAAKLGDQVGKFLALLDRMRSVADESSEKFTDLEQRLQQQLGSADSTARSLKELLSRADETIPKTMQMPERAPALLLMQIDKVSGNELAGLLYRLLEHPRASSKQLETGGDAAREVLTDDELAQLLYEKAIAVDPANQSARSEALVLLAELSDERGEVARENLRELATKHPGDKTVVINALNVFLGNDDYKGCRDFIEAAMDHSPFKALLWRNLAICREHIGDTEVAVLEAYEKASRLSEENVRSSARGRGDFVNTARPYARYLMDRSRWRDALNLIDKALKLDPLNGEVYILLGDYHRNRGSVSMARWAYGKAAEHGDHDITQWSIRRLEELDALEELDHQYLLEGTHVNDDQPPANHEELSAASTSEASADSRGRRS
ncbi:tetratricopeptide repeat protein [Streptomyces massasporeus]